MHLKKGRGNGHFATPLTAPTSFSVRHYAGLVTYDSAGFVEKNRDAIMPEHITVLKTSKVGDLYNVDATVIRSVFLAVQAADSVRDIC